MLHENGNKDPELLHKMIEETINFDKIKDICKQNESYDLTSPEKKQIKFYF